MSEEKLTPPNGSAGVPEWPGMSRRIFTTEEIEELLRRVKEPFEPSLVEWVVTATTKGNGGKLRGQVAAYADPRAYTDRLNKLFTAAGWTRDYTVQVVQNFERGKDNRVIAAKVMVACRLTIFGLGCHSGTGEEWADDQNALTRAEAQAFKRACVCFGLGRYFYDLPRTWVDLDDRKRPLQLPQLPAWALPQGGNGRANGGAGTADRRTQGGGNGRTSVGRIDAGKQSGLAKQTQELSKRIGRGLTSYFLAQKC